VLAGSGEVRRTRGDLLSAATRAARWIAATDAADRLIGIALADATAFLEALLGVWRAGRVPVLLDPDLTDAERAQVAHRLGIVHLIHGGADHLAPTGACRRPEAVPAESALIKLTSSSTGLPKGILVTQAQLLAEAAVLSAAFGLRAATRSLAVIPLAHSYGFGNLVLPLLTQGAPLVAGDPFDPRSTLRQAERAAVEVLPLVPLQVDLLSRLSDPPPLPASLRQVIAAGAPLPAPVAERFRRVYRLGVTRFYGTSETGPIACGEALSSESPTAPGSGRPMPGVQIEVLAEADETVGQLQVRSPAVAEGYYPDSDPVLGGGAFLTDDLGHVDGGELSLCGRRSRRINVAGRKVQPEEVERVLATIPGVQGAVVLGLQHGSTEEVVALVAGADGLLAADLRRACRAVLSAHKVPHRIVVVPAMPHTLRGKVDLQRVRAILHAELAEP
jgi:acyl-CoA synthetase (AMP-forming)/AMP-acid ligase II